MKNITREEIRKIYEDIEAGLKNMEEYGEFRCAEEKHKFRFAMYLGMYEAINTLASNVDELEL